MIDFNELISKEHIILFNLINENSLITITDSNGIILYVNDNFSKITGYKKEDLIGFTHRIIKHPDNEDLLYKEMWSILTSGNVYKKTIKNKDINNKAFYSDNTILPIKNKDEKTIDYYINLGNDVTELYYKSNLLESIRFCDKKTEMYNYEKLISDLKSYEYGVIVLVSIDDLDNINSFYGYEFADLLIKYFSNRFHLEFENFDAYCIESNRFIAFYGFENEKDLNARKDELVHEAKQRVKGLIHPFPMDNQFLSINTTTGMSAGETQTILSEARIAHSLAKENNKYFKVYNLKMKEKQKLYIKNKETSEIIKQALINDLVIPYYQPILNNQTNKIERYECLARILHNGVLLNPAGESGFIKISKISKQYPLITRKIIEKSFNTFTNTNHSFSINVSIEDIESEEMRKFIYKKVASFKHPDRIIFEILEDKDMMERIDILEEFIIRIKKLGAKIAIDDFGSGYSNFIVLTKLAIDYLKFDGSLIQALGEKTTYNLVKSLIEQSKERGIKTIAEYVENETVLSTVCELGFDYSQGFHIGKPNSNL